MESLQYEIEKIDKELRSTEVIHEAIDNATTPEELPPEANLIDVVDMEQVYDLIQRSPGGPEACYVAVYSTLMSSFIGWDRMSGFDLRRPFLRAVANAAGAILGSRYDDTKPEIEDFMASFLEAIERCSKKGESTNE